MLSHCAHAFKAVPSYTEPLLLVQSVTQKLFLMCGVLWHPDQFVIAKPGVCSRLFSVAYGPKVLSGSTEARKASKFQLQILPKTGSSEVWRSRAGQNSERTKRLRAQR